MLPIGKIGWLCGTLLFLVVVSTQAQPEQTPQAQVLLQRLSGKIVFQSNRDGDWEIYVMNVDGSNLAQLTHNGANDEYPVWSPDGSQIAFQTNRDGNYEIYVMNADGSQPRNLTNHPADDYSPGWSPDGKRLTFDSERDKGMEVYLMNSDGSEQTQLTDSFGKNILPDWSPDGQSITYTGNRYLGWNVYVTNLDRSDDKRITDGHGACRPDWSPDGKKIAYVSQQWDGKGDIGLMNPDGSDKTRLTPDDKNYDYHPAWSPDGAYIAYAKTPDKNTGNWEIYVMSADGQEHARITDHPAIDNFPDVARGRVPDELAKRTTIVYEAETSPRTLGDVQDDPDASAQQAVYTGATKHTGFLGYGPYELYQPGSYVARFRLKTSHHKEKAPILRIDVATGVGQTILAQQDVRGKDFRRDKQYQEFTLPFVVAAPQQVEFRVFYLGNAAVWVDRVAVTKN